MMLYYNIILYYIICFVISYKCMWLFLGEKETENALSYLVVLKEVLDSQPLSRASMMGVTKVST